MIVIDVSLIAHPPVQLDAASQSQLRQFSELVVADSHLVNEEPPFEAHVKSGNGKGASCFLQDKPGIWNRRASRSALCLSDYPLPF